MNADDRTSVSADILHGWKEIAVYLGRSVRSVQRWEHELDLPIHRLKTTDGQTVYGVRHELDAWRRGRGISELANGLTVGSELVFQETHDRTPPSEEPPDRSLTPRQPRRRVPWLASAATIALLIGVCVGALGVLILGRTTASPVSFAIVGQRLDARDDRGTLVWSHDFGRIVSPYEPVDPDTVHRPFTEIDFDPQQADVVVPVRYAPAGQKPQLSDGVYAFTRAGKVRWALTPDPVFVCGGQTYRGPWHVSAVTTSNNPASKRVWVAFRHHTWWPSFVIEIDKNGHQTLRYLQSGWITALATWNTPSGSFLLAGGVMNEQARASVALVDLGGSGAQSPHTTDRFACSGGGAGAPRRVWLLPRLDVTEAKQNAYALVQYASVAGSEAKISLDERAGSAVAQFAPDLTVSSFVLSDNYWAVHRALEQQNRIDHTADDCPERTRPHVVESWTSEAGWQEQIVSSSSLQTSSAAGRR